MRITWPFLNEKRCIQLVSGAEVGEVDFRTEVQSARVLIHLVVVERVQDEFCRIQNQGGAG